MTEHDVLVAARNLIDREGWLQVGGYTEQGGGLSRCAFGAIYDVVGYDGARGRDLCVPLLTAIGVKTPEALFNWNDAPGRAKEEVLAAFDKAIAATAPAPIDPFPEGRASFRAPSQEHTTSKAVIG